MLPIHNHSEYSALDGYSRVSEIADRIEALGLDGAFLTDHGTTAGLIPFAEEMQKRDLFFGFGMEAYQAQENRKERPKSITVKGDNGRSRKVTPRDSSHLIILAQNEEGYRNLLRLSDESNRTGFYYKPRVDWELLEKNREGLIVTSACMAGLVAKGVAKNDMGDLNKFLRIFKDDFFIELHTYDSDEQRELNESLVSIAKERGIPMVYANDAHYSCEDDYIYHEALICMQYRTSLDEDKGSMSNSRTDSACYHPPSMYIMGEDDVRESLSYLPQSVVDEAIENSNLIASRCQVDIPEVRTHLPVFFTGDDKVTSSDLLIDKVEAGLESIYGDDITDMVYDRAEYELREICKAGLADYFLIVQDMIEWARHKGIIVGPGRGSAAGSIISYALGITAVDPMKYDLHFERFWNPGRTDGLPDIDIDIEISRRGEIKEYLSNKYGRDRVLTIGNHIRMRPKMAIDKSAKVLYGDNCPYKDMAAIKKIIDQTVDAGITADWPAIWEAVGDELEPHRKKYDDVFKLAQAMTGRISTYGIHASAVVISDVDLPDSLPARITEDKKNKKKILVTQAEMHGVEDAGFPKFDLLGLRNLDTLKKTTLLAGVEDFDYRSINFDDMPLEFWEQIDNGMTLGLFQIEEGQAARRIGKELKPRNISDLAAIVAMNRPGPLRSGMVDKFLECRNGISSPVYSHEILVPILEETYGDFLYQEQVIAYFRAIGYSMSDADYIRKILGKKLVDKMNEEYERYIEVASKIMPEMTAKSIWQDIIGFSKYGFNKSHAVAYGMILAWTMYAKYTWPVEFVMASIMTNNERVGQYVTEAKRMGVDILKPDVNHSEVMISNRDDKIYFGLRDIKGVGELAAEWVIENRPYESYDHFMEKLDQASEEWKKVDKKVRHPRSPRQTTPKGMIRAMYNAGAFDTIEDREISEFEICQFEKELLGVELTDAYIDIKERHKEQIGQLDSIADITYNDKSARFTIPAVVTSVNRMVIGEGKRMAGKEMAIITVEFEGEQTKFAAFPAEWDSYKTMLKPRMFCRLKIEINKKGSKLIKGSRFV